MLNIFIDTKTRLSLEDFFLQNFQPLAWKHRISGSLKRGPTYLNSASKLISPTKSRANLKLQWFPPSCLTVMDFYSNKIAFRLEIIQKFASRLSGFEIVTDTKIRLRKWIFFRVKEFFITTKITKYHAADSKIRFLTKSILKPYGRATAMPPAWE